MEFHVAQILREPVGTRRDYDVDERCEGEPDAPPTLPVRGRVTLLRTDAGVLAMADLAGTIEADCSRCLSPAQLPVEIHVEEEYYPTVDVITGGRLPEPPESTPFIIDAHHILDLCEAVRQQLVLAEPLQPLCRTNCAGLCPTCGSNRNLGPCGCSADAGDARWALLGSLLQDTDD
jgi:uncharacterized protein